MIGTPPPPATFGEAVRSHRLRRSLSQQELAERTGISVRTLTEMECGRTRSPQRRTLDLLISGLELTEAEAVQFRAVATRERRLVSTEPAAGRPRSSWALPPLMGPLLGRELEQWELRRFAGDSRCSPPVRLAVVHGSPGVGKSALLLDTGHRLAGRFADGCCHLDLSGGDHGPVPPERAVQRVLRALGEQDLPADPEDQLARYRSLMRQRQVLLLLDGVVSEAQVRPLLATSPGSVVVAASQHTLAGLDAALRLPLGVLEVERAVELFGQTAGAVRAAVEAQAARRVAGLCGGLPLALVIAGRRLASRPQWTVAHLAGQLADPGHRLRALAAGDLQLRAVFEAAYQRLDPAAAAVFRLLALSPPTGMSVETAAALSHQDAVAAGTVLEQLVDASLLGVDGVSGHYLCHELLRLFAAEALEREDSAGQRPAGGQLREKWLARTSVAIG